ncbi:MAG: ATP-binding protein [Desulfosarcinaceae bacterium]|nr:ATP-binding protein [Desulfosarcinaceae bacterium]
MGLIRGFRANILTTFAVSLSLGMVLILLVVTSYYRKERLSQVEGLAKTVLWQAAGPFFQTSVEYPPDEIWKRLYNALSPYHGLSLSNAYLLKTDSLLLAQHPKIPQIRPKRVRAHMIKATVEKRPIQRRFGGQWLFPGRFDHFLLVCQPLSDTSAYKAIALLVDLKPIRKEIVKLNNLLLTYILVNLVVFSLIGAYRLNRIYMRPIQRMVKRAEDFREEDAIFFAARSGDDEINHLSKSLNLLLRRISEDKRQLQQTVDELEVANTNLKRAQDEVVRAETLASVGRLASGVAHEIGNPLGIVLGYLDLLANPKLGDSVRQDYLKRTEMEIQRINGIIRQLLDLSRPGDSQVDLIHLHPVLEDTVAMVGPQPLLKNITITTQLDANHDSVLAAPEQLRQVFLNLLLNAADAIAATDERPGSILIKSQLITNGNPSAPSEAETIELLFEDDGPGIPPELKGHIFEPFFTTKEPGKGTGLGLSVSFMIIESLNGQLTAETLEGGGTRMRIRLPLYAGEAPVSTT